MLDLMQFRTLLRHESSKNQLSLVGKMFNLNHSPNHKTTGLGERTKSLEIKHLQVSLMRPSGTLLNPP